MINSLALRIFAIFRLTLSLALMCMLIVLNLDSSQITQLLYRKERQSVMLKQHVDAELAAEQANALMCWRRLFLAIDQCAAPGQRLILASSEGRIITAKHNKIHIIRNFIDQLDNTEHPQKKKYGHVELAGPFAIHDSENNYQLYQIQPAGGAKSVFISPLFDGLLLLLIIMILIHTLLLLWLAWNLAKPARKLKHTVNKVAPEDARQNLTLEVKTQEFLATDVCFKQIVRALERIVIAQQRLLSDISHELRTPLTRLQLATALMRRRHGEGDELARIETEAQRLDSMINDLLVLSRNQHKNKLSPKVLKVNELWSNVLRDAQFEAKQMDKSLELTSPPGNWTLIGNASALDSALENIVRNALRYAHRRISVGFSADQQGITITVDDDGPGVSKDNRKQIFRPFYRADEAQDRESGGTGLGLTIVENAVMQHRGWVKAEDSPLGGLRLIIWLPLLLNAEVG
ncbi:MAG: envelope stress sensor histidine kinase CpxA [Sodalis sp. (in: enterobacteria)]